MTKSATGDLGNAVSDGRMRKHYPVVIGLRIPLYGGSGASRLRRNGIRSLPFATLVAALDSDRTR